VHRHLLPLLRRHPELRPARLVPRVLLREVRLERRDQGWAQQERLQCSDRDSELAEPERPAPLQARRRDHHRRRDRYPSG
jgi:hypothetical protein